jgi:hypothetical protein
MLMWSKPDAIVPDEPLRWILATLRFYAIVASVGFALAFAVIFILAGAPGVVHEKGIVPPVGTGQTNRIGDSGAPGALHEKGIVPPVGTGQIDRIERGNGTMVVWIAMIILFIAATYFTGRSYGTAGLTTGGIACVIILIALWALSGFGFG